MREDIIEKAYAKINISLDVTARRDDGYHDMAMVMQTVSLCDDVRLGFTDGSRIFARTNLPFIPGDERNLAVRAAKKFFDDQGVKKLPTVKSLQSEYAALMAEKKQTYSEYRKVREDRKELLTAKANVDRILGMDISREERAKEKETGQW